MVALGLGPVVAVADLLVGVDVVVAVVKVVVVDVELAVGSEAGPCLVMGC